jgi:hypothetical protein
VTDDIRIDDLANPVLNHLQRAAIERSGRRRPLVPVLTISALMISSSVSGCSWTR